MVLEQLMNKLTVLRNNTQLNPAWGGVVLSAGLVAYIAWVIITKKDIVPTGLRVFVAAVGLRVFVAAVGVSFLTILTLVVVTMPFTIELQVTAVKEEVSIEEINEYFVASDIVLDDKNIICTLTPDKEHYRDVREWLKENEGKTNERA